MKRASEIRTSHSIITLIERNLIELRPVEGWKGVIRMTEIQEIVTALDNFARPEQRLVLAYLPEFEVSNEAQMYVSSLDPLAKAIAFVSKSMIQTLLGNLLINIRKIKTPSKLFNSRKSALNWLHEQGESTLKNSA